MPTLVQDVRYALRVLLKSPGFAVVAILTLALGIGANTALFSIVKTVLLTGLPYRQPECLVTLAAKDRDTLNPVNVSFGLVRDWKQRSHSFSSIALYRDWSPTLTGPGKPQMLRGMRVSYDFFETLGIAPVHGRPFSREEDRPDRRRVLLLSYAFWKDSLGGRADAVGTSLLINQTPFQIVGVLPENFRPLIFSDTPEPPQVWAPLGYDAAQPYACRSCQHLRSVARLRDGVQLGEARAEMNAVAKVLAREFPDDYAPEFSAVVTPLRDRVVGDVRTALLLLFGATSFVLLIACANIANLFLSRASARRRELAVRAALGAGPLRLAGQLLTESVLLTLVGGAAGAVLAAWGVQAFAAWAPVAIPRLAEVRTDPAVLSFALFVSLAAGILAGLVPAIRAARADQRETLQTAGRGVSLDRSRLRPILVVSEIALAFVLVVGTGLLVKSLGRVLAVHPGFETSRLYTVNVALVGQQYDVNATAVQFEREALDRIRALPGVESAALVSTLPLGGGFDRRGFHIQDRRFASSSEAPSVDGYYVSPGYFETMRIPLLRGRTFTESDVVLATSAPVAVISETTARQMWPGGDPLGKRIQLGGREENKPWAMIIGIVGDVRQYGLDSAPTADAYLLHAQDPSSSPIFVIRSTLASASLTRAVEQQIASLDKEVPVYGAAMMEKLIASSVSQRRFVASGVAAFGLLALMLASIGIYGVMSYHVAQRTGEFGVRMALGGQLRDILSLVLTTGAKLTAAGVGLGLAGGFALSRVLRSLLYDVSPADPLTFALVTLVMVIVPLAACWVPARRATRIDPMVALRYE